MKQLLLIGTFAAFALSCDAQCVVYTCKNTGAIGASYNDQDEKLSMEELDARAKATCERDGGTNCRMSYSSHLAGWWAFMSSRTQKGTIAITVVMGKKSQGEAEQAVKDEHPETGSVVSWLVYNNVR
jgi:hypothetical protein